MGTRIGVTEPETAEKKTTLTLKTTQDSGEK